MDTTKQKSTEKLGHFFRNIATLAGHSIKKNWLFALLNFIFINVFVQGFQFVFGAVNTIIAVIMTILMGILAGKSVAAAPVKTFVTQTAAFVIMAVAACYTRVLGTWIAIPINLIVIFCILYAYTYEYSYHLYFPYILSYLFLVYISPVTPTELPTRLISIVVASACMILYALVLGYRNIRKPAKKSVSDLLHEVTVCLDCLVRKTDLPDNEQAVREAVRTISRHADQCKKGVLDLSDGVIAYLDIGRGLENLVVLLHSPIWKQECYSTEFFAEVQKNFDALSHALDNKTPIREIALPGNDRDENVRRLEGLLNFVREGLSVQNNVCREEKPRVPIREKIKRAIDYSPVKMIYAVRVTILLTAFMIPVQLLNLAHGKWLLFTLASVSLPYKEDVVPKGAKRMIATLIGGTVVTILYSLIPNSIARTAILLLSGFLSFFFPGYTGNYACATIGALGGAAMTANGWGEVSLLFGIRAGYILVGILIAVSVNVLIFPYSRKQASAVIFKKYDATSRVLIDIPVRQSNPQLYYSLVIQNNLLEDKLLDNAKRAGKDINDVTKAYRRAMRHAHRFTSDSPIPDDVPTAHTE